MNNTFSFQQIAAPKVLSAEVREAISNNVLQFYVRDQQQDTQDEGITALYERLSQEDKLEGESNSIANQKKILERYCREHGITAYRHYDEDDGYSGTNFNRPGFQRMLADIKAGKIKRVIVKDMSMTELTVRGAKMSLPQSVMCSMRCTPATLQRRYALLGNQRGNPANILPQSRLTAT